MNDRRIVTGLYGAAALMGAGAFVCPPLLDRRDGARTSAVAEAGLQLLADAERTLFAAEGRFAGFGPAAADRAAVLPHARLGAEFDDLSFDAMLDRQGVLQLRAMSRAEAVRAGRAVPLVKTLQLVQGNAR